MRFPSRLRHEQMNWYRDRGWVREPCICMHCVRQSYSVMSLLSSKSIKALALWGQGLGTRERESFVRLISS